MTSGTWYVLRGYGYVVCGTWYVTCDTWYMVHGTWYVTSFLFITAVYPSQGNKTNPDSDASMFSVHSNTSSYLNSTFTLNPDAPSFIPEIGRILNSFLNPEAISFVPNQENKNLDETPIIIEINTPNSSFENTKDIECVTLFQNVGISAVNNVSFRLYTFIFTSILLSIFIIAYIVLDLWINSDHDSPQNILQTLRLKNVDRILIGHLNINSIRIIK